MSVDFVFYSFGLLLSQPYKFLLFFPGMMLQVQVFESPYVHSADYCMFPWRI